MRSNETYAWTKLIVWLCCVRHIALLTHTLDSDLNLGAVHFYCTSLFIIFVVVLQWFTMDKVVIECNNNDILGEGTFGYVFSGIFCFENGNRTPVAVKRIHHKNVNSDEREIKALETLKEHPNTVRLYGAKKDGDYQ